MGTSRAAHAESSYADWRLGAQHAATVGSARPSVGQDGKQVPVGKLISSTHNGDPKLSNWLCRPYSTVLTQVRHLLVIVAVYDAAAPA